MHSYLSDLSFASPPPKRRRLNEAFQEEMWGDRIVSPTERLFTTPPREEVSPGSMQPFESQDDFSSAIFHSPYENPFSLHRSSSSSHQYSLENRSGSPENRIPSLVRKALFQDEQEFEIRQGPLFSESPRRTQAAFIPRYRPATNENGLPKKPSRYQPEGALKHKPPFLQNAVAIQHHSRFPWQEEMIRIKIQDHLMKGQFNIFATICPNQKELIPGRDNSQIALKTFRDHCIMVQNGPDKLQYNAPRNVLDQYNQLCAAKIPVSEIYNTEEALNGCGFFLVEFVPHPFEIWEKGTPLKWALEGDSFQLLEQLQDIFYTAYHADIIPDLKPSNLRIRENGVLTIIDLRENQINPKLKDSMFKEMLKTFNCEEGDEIYTFLNPIIPKQPHECP